jgi:hypothetical protein
MGLDLHPPQLSQARTALRGSRRQVEDVPLASMLSGLTPPKRLDLPGIHD